ncbi:MAG: 50S ribosomal protein L23 [Anaerolineae bacterium]
MHTFEVLKRPITTEKAYALAGLYNQYAFEVDCQANKIQVKKAVEDAFRVNVLDVKIINIPAKKGRHGRRIVTRKPARKKAIVTLAEGQKIPLFEGV